VRPNVQPRGDAVRRGNGSEGEMTDTSLSREPDRYGDGPRSRLPRLSARAARRTAAVPGTFDPSDLRRAMGGFATGVTVVTARAPSGQRAGITVNSFCSVSLEPPLVLWCIARTAPSLPVFAAGSHFAIHVLAADQAALGVRFSRPAADKFAGLECSEGLGGVPLLDGAAVRFECSREHCYESGDHLILIGRIERYCYSECTPLLFHGGRMHSVHGD
jgi:flavin reductase (DIM6/NTAB) family NADH-FMN oxidoreductase RutF